jgi:hypothetical protein
VLEWVAKRNSSLEARSQKSDSPKEDPKAKENRARKRRARVDSGLEECEKWIRDGIQQGLAGLQTLTPKAWRQFAARMVDAQAPGVARLIREMSGTVVSGDGWQDRLLERMSMLYLLLQAYSRIDELPPGNQADIRALIGWTINKEDLPESGSLQDRWSVLGQRTYPDERLTVQMSWLQGMASGRFGLVLGYSVAGQPFDFLRTPGTSFDGQLVFYPSAYPLRAVPREASSAPWSGIMEGSVASMVESLADALTCNPWITEVPACLGPVRLGRVGEQWVLADGSGSAPLSPAFADPFHLLAISGGNEFGVFGEWDGREFLPLGASSGGRFHKL